MVGNKYQNIFMPIMMWCPYIFYICLTIWREDYYTGPSSELNREAVESHNMNPLFMCLCSEQITITVNIN